MRVLRGDFSRGDGGVATSTAKVSLLLAMLILLGGCRRHAERVSDPPAAASGAPQPAQPPGQPPGQPPSPRRVAVRGVDADARTFTSPVTGVRLAYPQGWQPTSSNDFDLMLVPANSMTSAAPSGNSWPERFISLDIPELPAVRIPGFLPMDQIRKGYLDDLRHQCPGAKSENVAPPVIPNAKVAMVHSVWPTDHPTHAETALLMTHADRVYILRGRSSLQDESATRAAFDQIAQSLRWQGK